MPATQRRFGTVAVVVSTAVLTAALTAGGPAIAASVVDFAKNAGAVDGKSAVAANATLNQRKGKLVATGATTGLLPNTIIAQAPDSAKLGGIPLSGLAPALLHAGAGSFTLTTDPIEACRTAVLTTTTAAVATIEGDLNIGSSKISLASMTIDVSLDGGTTWKTTDGGWTNDVDNAADQFAGISHVTVVAIPAHTRVRFALGLSTNLTGNGPDLAVCSLTATVLHRTPGTVLSSTVTLLPPTAESGRQLERAR